MVAYAFRDVATLDRISEVSPIVRDHAPSLAIEVNYTSISVGRMRIYAALGGR